jgi:hypothetical protein
MTDVWVEITKFGDRVRSWIVVMPDGTEWVVTAPLDDLLPVDGATR